MTIPRVSTSVSKGAIALTGTSGRLGRYLVSAFENNGIDVVPVPRDVLEGSSLGIVKYFEKTRPLAVVNSAAISQGSFESMMSVNVTGAVKLGDAAKQIKLPFFQMSTTATAIPGISQEKTPYAWSKSMAKNELLSGGNLTIVDLDALIGTSQANQIDISSLAAGGAPLAVKMMGSRHIIQPTSYSAAAKTIANLVSECIKGHPIPSRITIAGEPIALGDFVQLIKSEEFLFKKIGLELHIQPEDLLKFAELVKNGSLCPEFLHLGSMASENPQIHDNEDFQHYHGDPIPTHVELAGQMRKTTTANIFKTMANIYKDSPKKLDLVVEAFRVWDKCTIKKNRVALEEL